MLNVIENRIKRYILELIEPIRINTFLTKTWQSLEVSVYEEKPPQHYISHLLIRYDGKLCFKETIHSHVRTKCQRYSIIHKDGWTQRYSPHHQQYQHQHQHQHSKPTTEYNIKLTSVLLIWCFWCCLLWMFQQKLTTKSTIKDIPATFITYQQPHRQQHPEILH